MADIVIINPQFEVSFWGLEYALPLFGKRANLPVAALPLLAALTPEEHNVTLIDENVEAIDFDQVAKADLVGVTGMSVQRFRMKEILEELKARDVFTVVGGPWVTVQEDYFEGLADVIFIGEAEETWPRFLNEWKQGLHQYRYEQASKTDMTTVPTPRLDLIKNHHYMFGSVQFSRGCPFQCEFCDIIVTFGRRPRIKSADQIIAEIDNLHKHKMRVVFIVDDNLIGNKKGIKPVLERLAEWQEKKGYPFVFFTEASLDLSEDEELMELFGRCNIQSVFIGIETPNEESLKETRKFQNVREKGGTILDKIHKIQDFGIEVWCGMILGFDHDDDTIFNAQQEFLSEARIAHAMVGMLHAIPKTPLHARLEEEGRLDLDDQPEFGTNVIPLQMSREDLREGYLQTMKELYDADSYFGRLDQLYLNDRFRFRSHDIPYWKKNKFCWYKHCAEDFAAFVYSYFKLMRNVPDKGLRKEYRRRIWKVMKSRPFEPAVHFWYVIKCAMHYHHYTLAEQINDRTQVMVNSF